MIGHVTGTVRLSIDVCKSQSWSTSLLTWAFVLERVKGIEPSLSAWEADVLPLNYTRGGQHCTRVAPRAARMMRPYAAAASAPLAPNFLWIKV